MSSYPGVRDVVQWSPADFACSGVVIAVGGGAGGGWCDGLAGVGCHRAGRALTKQKNRIGVVQAKTEPQRPATPGS